MLPTRRLLLSLALTSAAVGLAEPHLPHPGHFPNEISLAQGIVGAMLLFSWCKADAFARGIVPPVGSSLLVGLLAPIGVPYYFFRIQSWRLALRSIGMALAYYVAISVLYVGCFYLSVRIS